MDNSYQNLEALLSQNNPPLRQRRQRTSFNDETIMELEEKFSSNPYPDINEREAMAMKFKTTEDRIQVWFQNKRARFRKRMHKENDKTSKSEKKSSKKSSEMKTELQDTPLKSSISEDIYNIKTISTPISANSTSYRPNLSFNSSSPLLNNTIDSAYYSQNSSMELNKSVLSNQYVSFNSPLTLQSPNLPLHPFNFSPFQHYYSFNPITYMNLSQQNYYGMSTSSFANVNTQANRTQRTVKSVFKPYE